MSKQNKSECCEKCITDWNEKNCDCPCHSPVAEKEKCDCKEKSCKRDCSERHTHKSFFCEVCRPPEKETPAIIGGAEKLDEDLLNAYPPLSRKVYAPKPLKEDWIKKWLDESGEYVDYKNGLDYVCLDGRFNLQSLLTQSYEKGREEERMENIDFAREEKQRGIKIGREDEREKTIKLINGLKKDTHGVIEPIIVGDTRIAGIVNHGFNLALDELLAILSKEE